PHMGRLSNLFLTGRGIAAAAVVTVTTLISTGVAKAVDPTDFPDVAGVTTAIGAKLYPQLPGLLTFMGGALVFWLIVRLVKRAAKSGK
ncbi:MAG: hypothetical protein WCI73_18125, partial [Phycisphaerae bacterium]